MKSPFSFPLVGVAVLGLAFLTSCGGTPGKTKPHKGSHVHFEGWDTNDDGRLSYAEFSKSSLAKKSSSPRTTFNQIDRNGDGYVSLDELKEYRRAHKKG